MDITVIGGGLAGVEAAHQITRMGGRATLFEMRPVSGTPAHRTSYLAELVCSNSLKSIDLHNAHGLLKEELRRMGSSVMEAADGTAIPGGKALVVDRDRFAARLTETVENNPGIRLVREEARRIPKEGIVIVASGPLTSEALTEELRVLTGADNLAFFDAISPIVDAASIDHGKAFYASRYMKGEAGDYLNCPLSREEYDLFHEALVAAERVDLREFEKTSYFEGCLPVEVLAERGKRTLAFGPMKPVGLMDPRDGRRPYAVVQLRKENASGTMLNLVGFQTKMKYPEQERVFRMIPALKDAVFLRYGSIHRNTYINAPLCLNDRLELKADRRVLFAGQITGVEGYMESTAMGLVAGISAFMSATGREFHPPPPVTCIGALIRYLTTENKNFQPMNINFGLIEGYSKKNKEATVTTALQEIEKWKNSLK
ncbi:MAG: Methylenetetrahydrofolate--tRNA-(uracil-5-)-methyltransferase TrmFO [Syntrophorhabdus sp. PtaB.Bin047]|jgi:methylenetetrahydrofolate--tRNA-(uracil-5-)-methyltransferase|nr:MAG: Methylenetetrahydrofolate--tRNA-(uracil-5-)-methyltransferase TrmFO [Syntrophorhabdus sp. PtaB.Bin047]